MSSSSFSIPLILAILSCLFNIVCAEFRYYGPTIGGSIGGLVSSIDTLKNPPYLSLLDHINS